MKQPERPGDNTESLATDLLSLCAILRWFDHELLRDLAAAGEDAIGALLASELVAPAPDSARAYRLRDDACAEGLAKLRADDPSNESTLHTRVFEHFLQGMPKATPPERRMAYEDGCFHHLSKLFLLLASRKEWQTIAGYVAAARAAGPEQPRHHHRLALYDGYVALNMQEYDRGAAILMRLVDQAGVEFDVQMLAFTGLAHIHWYQTQYDRALALHQKAHALALEHGDRFYQGGALANMGMIYNEIGYYEQAFELSSQSLDIFRELGDSSREAHALYAVGNNALQLGRWHMAQENFHQAIRLYEALGIQAGLAYLYWGQGSLYQMLGDEAESERYYLHALRISESPDHTDLSVARATYSQLGLLYQTQSRWDEALAAYDQAIELAARLGNQHWLSLVHYRRGNIFERQGRLGEALAVYAQAIEGIETLRGATEAEEIKIGLLGTAQQVYESMVLLCLALEQPAEAFHYVERARSRAFLDMLDKKQSADDPTLYAALAKPVATLAETQAQLREDALLLEYFTIGVLPRGESLINRLPPENTRLREHLTLPPQTIIFAITRGGMEILHPSLDPNTLRPQPGDPGPGRRLLRDRLLTHLHAQLIAPAAELLRERALLYLIPHGPLHYVPFMALRSADGAHLLGADGPAIALAPSATVLLRNCLSRPAVAGPAAPLLALGYNDQGEAGLRYAEAEASHIARLAGGQAWADREAKSRRLIAAAPPPRWLHIAGHAVYDPHDPLGSYIQLGEDDPLSARAIMRELVLDADLVTLSACMSGISQVMSGDELLGLQRAFLYAGASAVVCTLWEAADFVALLVMDRFYAGLRGGSPPAGALRDAQVALRGMTGRGMLETLDRWRAEDPAFIAALGDLPQVPPDALDTPIYADPFYWAPFMLIGKPD